MQGSEPMRTYYITPEDYRIAEKNGISKKNVEKRVRGLGWNVDRAITTPIRKKRDYKAWRPVLEKNGVPYNRFKRRVADGWSLERAATESKEVG